jgi:hypothetical protein
MTDFDPRTLAKQLVQHGHEWAESNCAADLLEEMRKSLRSQIALKFLPDAGSVAKAEMMAESTQEYIDHIKSMVEARKKSNASRVQYDADRAFIDLILSQESSRRAEMNMR